VIFDLFKKKIVPADKTAAAPDPELRAFLDHHAGTVLHNGMYRVVTAETRKMGQEFIREAFAHRVGRVEVFGYSWLGNMFCLDSERIEGGARGVLLLEPGTGEELEIPANLTTFHEVELVQEPEAALAKELFDGWTALGGPAPGVGQCIGYKKPLFLGGADEVGNLEVSDLDVYWTISAQLIRQVRGLPKGTKINRVTIS